ncbi:hypothetical protein F5883DRAFT_35805 [Diaporthe sp. PMI_573]|nr:hypothetical protein F5883DRAFT_35805 [Diaporthaceae sp. PMI_573]
MSWKSRFAGTPRFFWVRQALVWAWVSAESQSLQRRHIGQAPLTSRSRHHLGSRNARGGHRIQGTLSGPLPVKNKGWNHLVSRRRQLNVWFREQGQRDEQCSPDTASCQRLHRTRRRKSRRPIQQQVKLDLISSHFPVRRRAYGRYQAGVIKQRCCVARTRSAL